MEFIFIKNYKAIKLLKIDSLSRVNVFTGKNNTGKSSLLEAIALLASQGSLKWIKIILELRGENVDNDFFDFDRNYRILASLFSNRNNAVNFENIITIESSNKSFFARFVYYVKNYTRAMINGKEVFGDVTTILSKDEEDEDKKVGLEIGNDEDAHLLEFDTNMLKINSLSQESTPIHFINSYGKALEESSVLWDKITLTDKEDSVVEALRIIDPKIQRLSFISEEYSNNKRYPVVKLEGSKEVLPLQSMGDGINRILKVILAAVNCENGTLLIDEFENGLHHSVQQKLWEVIFSISKKLNIQVFVTTHSEDAIHTFAKVLEKDETNEGSLYRLAYRNDNLTANLFTEEEIKNAAKLNIDLR